MKALILLASIAEDEDEAKSCYLKAESLWQMVRRANKAGDRASVDNFLDEIRKELDDLKRELDPDEDLTEGTLYRSTCTDVHRRPIIQDLS